MRPSVADDSATEGVPMTLSESMGHISGACEPSWPTAEGYPGLTLL